MTQYCLTNRMTIRIHSAKQGTGRRVGYRVTNKQGTEKQAGYRVTNKQDTE